MLRAAIPLLLPLAIASIAIGKPQDPGTVEDLIAAFEKKVRTVSDAAGPGVVCLVVSRSDAYSKPDASAILGQLGGFDPDAFLKIDPTPERAALARKLDLSDRENIPDHSTAGGVVIDAGGFILTTYAAIENATKIYVHFANGNGSYADIHAADARSDFAVLRLLTPTADLPVVPIGEARPDDIARGARRTVYPGKLMVLLALTYSANGEMRQTSAWVGNIASVQRRLLDARELGGRNLTWYNYGFVLEFQTVLRPQGRGGIGASLGGNGIPLLNLEGEVIGLTTTQAAAVGADPGPGYALPIDANGKRIIEVLRRGEEVEYGFLGVVVGQGGGLGLNSVAEQSPAWQAGLRGGDTITHINGVAVNRYEDLLLQAGTALAGSKIPVRVLGLNGVERDTSITLAKFKNESPFIASRQPEAVFGLRVDYSSLLSQTFRGGPNGVGGVPLGVSIREIIPNSPAATRFKALGDNPNRFLITAVNGTRTPNPADFYKATRGQATVKLSVLDVTEQNPQERDITLP